MEIDIFFKGARGREIGTPRENQNPFKQITNDFILLNQQ